MHFFPLLLRFGLENPFLEKLFPLGSWLARRAAVKSTIHSLTKVTAVWPAGRLIFVCFMMPTTGTGWNPHLGPARSEQALHFRHGRELSSD